MTKKAILVAMQSKLGLKMNRVQFNFELQTLETNSI